MSVVNRFTVKGIAKALRSLRKLAKEQRAAEREARRLRVRLRITNRQRNG